MKIGRFLAPVIAMVVLLSCFITMQYNNKKRFDEMDKRYSETISVNLDKDINEQCLAEVLDRNGYTDNMDDAKFIASILKSKLAGDTIPDAITDLSKRKWQIPVTLIENTGTASFMKKMYESRISLGLTEEVDSLYQFANVPVMQKTEEGGKGSIIVTVKKNRPETEINWWDRLWRKTLEPASNVLVRLDEHMLDSTGVATYTTLTYAMTDNEGKAIFSELKPESSYSVLPIKNHYEFGTAKGTIQGSLGKVNKDAIAEYSFTMQPHLIRLFSSQTLQQMKEDCTITVRTPQIFNDSLQLWFILFMVASLLLFVLGNVGHRNLNNGMATLLILIGGFSLMLMFGINDPLTEKLLGVETAQGIVAGLVLVSFMQLIDFTKLYQDEYKIPFDLFAYVFSRSNYIRYQKYKGFSYLVLAIVITASLEFIGQSVGGMKVNINFFGIPIQPSEIAKYLMVIFMATWFCRNGEIITRYSEETAINAQMNTSYVNLLFWRKIKHMSGILLGLLLLLGIYARLGDMGPALVVSLTFIVLYSLVKSKSIINKDGLDDNPFTCDMAFLIYGVGSFLILLIIGQIFDIKGIMTIIWFVGWYFWGFSQKRIYESAIMFNLIISAFIFGPDLLSGTSVSERLEMRNEMCINTWGNLALQGGIPEPGVNIQVAEGLWGLASGGLIGQGVGNGSQHFIPAFHTDFILESIGEQLGFIGLTFLVILFSLLLWKSLLAGFHSRHHFSLFLCAGIAIVTGIQFIIISLGSTGIIPLTGITVPFFSYGRVSLVFNLLAFGVILSVTSRTHKVSKQESYMSAYANPILMTCLSYTMMLVLIIGVFFHYQVINREETLLRPAFVYNKEGAVSVYYNPRINKLSSAMKPGNIYDRNGILIATSFPDSLKTYQNIYSKYGIQTDFRKVQDRYYPFGEHLFFMLGDYNHKLFFSSVDENPRGYMADARHLAELRGYDNVLRHSDGTKLQIDLKSTKFKPGKFLPAESEYYQDGFQLRDYSALLPYLKAGYASNRVHRFNERNENLLDFGTLEPKDLYLTIDAALQTRLQQALSEQSPATDKYSHLQRTSVVVIDACSGDLLASANWPLPDYSRLAEETDTYYDRYRKKGEWNAYTDMDLGLTFATPPGSTAKVMSALAGLRKLDTTGGNIQDKNYNIYAKELIHTSNGSEPIGYVGMFDAIVKSSNVYFINLVNDMDLYNELAYIYESAGIYIGVPNNQQKPAVPAYKFDYTTYNPECGWRNRVTDEAAKATATYRNYVEHRKGTDPTTHRHMTFCEPWRWAWGQGTMDATPLGMARVAATVVNDGKMPVTRYLLTEDAPQYIPIASQDRVQYLKKAMVAEAHKMLNDGKSSRFLAYPSLGGKTGTPERVLDRIPKKGENLPLNREPVNPPKGNDGWYICFVEDALVSKINNEGKIENVTTSLAIAVRAERTIVAGSGYAKNLADKTVMKILAEQGYFK